MTLNELCQLFDQSEIVDKQIQIDREYILSRKAYNSQLFNTYIYNSINTCTHSISPKIVFNAYMVCPFYKNPINFSYLLI